MFRLVCLTGREELYFGTYYRTYFGAGTELGWPKLQWVAGNQVLEPSVCSARKIGTLEGTAPSRVIESVP